MIYLRQQNIDIDGALKAHTEYFYSVALKKLGIPFANKPSIVGSQEFYNSCEEIADGDKSKFFKDFKNWLIDEDKINLKCVS